MGTNDGALRTFFDKISRNLMAPTVRGRPWTYGISDGTVSGKTPLLLFGLDASGTSSPTLSPVWTGSSSGYPYPTADQTIKVKSTDADDDDGDTGANTIRVWWLDSANNESTLDVTMDGTTSVVTAVVTMRRINRAEVLTCGASGGNEGTISIYGTDGVTVLAQIPIVGFSVGDGRSNGAMRTVPAGKRDVITRIIDLQSSTENQATVILRYRTSPSSPWLNHSNTGHLGGVIGPGRGYVFDTPIVLDAGTDYGVWIAGTVTDDHQVIVHGWTETV